MRKMAPPFRISGWGASGYNLLLVIHLQREPWDNMCCVQGNKTECWKLHQARAECRHSEQTHKLKRAHRKQLGQPKGGKLPSHKVKNVDVSLVLVLSSWVIYASNLVGAVRGRDECSISIACDTDR